VYISNAGVNRQERLGKHARGQLRSQEFGDVVADPLRKRRGLAEPARFVGQVGFHHPHDLRGVDGDDRRAYAVRRRINRNLLAIRRIGGLVNVVQPQKGRRMMAIELDDDLFRQIAEGGRGTDRGSQQDTAASRKVGRFHYGHVHGAQKAVARDLRHQGKVQVEEARLSRIDAVAQVAIGLVRRAKLHGPRFGQRAIERRAGGGAGQDADLELPPGIVSGDGTFRNRQRDRLRHARRGESAESHVLSVLDEGSSFGCGKNRK
jgi:hypothetical protein